MGFRTLKSFRSPDRTKGVIVRKILAAVAISVATLGIPAAAHAAAPVRAHSVAATHRYVVIAGTYSTQAKAESRLSKLGVKGFTSFAIVTKKTGRKTHYLVQDGPMVASAARALSKSLAKKHFGSSIKRVS